MRSLTRMGAASAAVLLLALAACADSTAPGNSSITDPDAALASLAADGVGENLDMLRGQGLPGLGIPGLLFPPPNDSGAPCRGPGGPGAPGGPQPCPPMDRLGVTFLRTVTYFDAAGVTQDAYDSLTTASINFVVSVSAGDSGEARILREQRDLTVSGLAGLETSATWNGTGSSYRLGAPPMGPGMGGPGMRGGMGPGGRGSPGRPPRGDSLPPRPPGDSLPPRGDGRIIEATTNSTIDDVVVPVPQGPDAWPLSGTISQDATITVTLPTGETRTRTRTAVVTFNGTQFVPLVIDGDTTIIDLRARGRGDRFGLPRPGRP